ncbi:DUF4298 domain-containing protein [Aerococcaceae bacterium 50-4]
MKDEFDFYKMEENFWYITDELKKISANLDKFEKSIPNIQLFLKYYESKEWMKHYKMAEQGLLAESSTSAVIGEDYSYDLVMDIVDLANRFQKISEQMTERS